MTQITTTIKLDADTISKGVKRMARKKQTVEKAEATGTVQARRKAEQARQKEARAARAEVAASTVAAQKATSKRLADKPTDSRKLVS